MSKKRLIKPKGKRKEFYRKFARFMKENGRRPNQEEVENELGYNRGWSMNNIGKLDVVERRIKKGVVIV